MTIDRTELLALPVKEKLELVELLWDDLGNAPTPIPIPEWAIEQAKQRQTEMTSDSSCGISETKLWRRVAEHRNG